MRLSVLSMYVFVGIAALGVDGCSTGPATESVEGLVTLDGAPLDNVRVTFQPQASGAEAGIGSTGLTDDKGRFVLKRVDNDRQGAVVGKHTVTFSDKLAEAGAEDSADAGPALNAPQSRIPTHYGENPLTFEVKAGQKNEANFDLKSTR
mgnify:CR=1 FL=1